MLAPVILAAAVQIAGSSPAVSSELPAGALADSLTRASLSAPPRTLRVAVGIVRQKFSLEIDPRSARWSGSWGAVLAFPDRRGPFELGLTDGTVSHAELHVLDAGARSPGRLTWGLLRPGVLLLETSGEHPGRSDVLLRYEGAFSDSGAGLVRDPAAGSVRLRRALGHVVPSLAEGGAARVDFTLWTPPGYDVRTNAHRVGRERVRGAIVWSFTTIIGPDRDSLRAEIVPARGRER